MITTRLAAETLRLLPRKRLSRALGRAASVTPPSPWLARAIELYVKAYDVDLSECVVPEGGFRSFNEFFARPLRDGARPLEGDESTLVSPADGRVEDIGPIDLDGTLHIKGRPYRVSELLDDTGAVEAFAGGQFAVVYLSPRDYHRVHAPVGGPVRRVQHVPGTLYPVNSIGVQHVNKLFARNERVVVVQDAPRRGRVATSMVGALVVGGIELAFGGPLRTASTTEHDGDAPELARGAELGRFLIGSTAIVFTTPELGATPVVRPGSSIRMGRALFTLGGSAGGDA